MSITRLRYTGDTLTAERGSKRVHVHTYFAKTDDPQMSSLSVLADPLCPRELSVDPLDPFARVVSVNAKRKSQHSRCTWELSVTTTTEVDDNPNPLEAPAKWSVHTVLYEVPATRDREDNWIMNKAGVLIQGAKRTVLGHRFTARLSIPDESCEWLDQFADAVNDSDLTIKGRLCGKENVLLSEVQIGEPQKDFGVTHCPTTMVFEHNPLGFNYEPLNQGFCEIEETRTRGPRGKRGTAGRVTVRRRLVEITDERGQSITEPKFLDENGRRPRVNVNGIEQIKHPLDASDIIVLKFPVKKLANFGLLPIRWS